MLVLFQNFLQMDSICSLLFTPLTVSPCTFISFLCVLSKHFSDSVHQRLHECVLFGRFTLTTSIASQSRRVIILSCLWWEFTEPICSLISDHTLWNFIGWKWNMRWNKTMLICTVNIMNVLLLCKSIRKFDHMEEYRHNITVNAL